MTIIDLTDEQAEDIEERLGELLAERCGTDGVIGAADANYAIGILGNILAGFLTGAATNSYLNTSLLLAFAVLYPDMEFMLFFFLPVKVRWIGWAWGLYLLYQLFTVPWTYKVALVLSLLPFVLFFGKQAWLQLRMDGRRLLRWININLRK